MASDYCAYTSSSKVYSVPMYPCKYLKKFVQSYVIFGNNIWQF